MNCFSPLTNRFRIQPRYGPFARTPFVMASDKVDKLITQMTVTVYLQDEDKHNGADSDFAVIECYKPFLRLDHGKTS